MPTVYSNLHIVVSDDPEGHLPNWLLNRIDRSFRLRFALEAQVVQRLAQLDRIGVIELRPLNRYRLRLSKAFRWRPHGPVMEYFRDHAMVDYFSGVLAGSVKACRWRTFQSARAWRPHFWTGCRASGRILRSSTWRIRSCRRRTCKGIRCCWPYGVGSSRRSRRFAGDRPC